MAKTYFVRTSEPLPMVAAREMFSMSDHAPSHRGRIKEDVLIAELDEAQIELALAAGAAIFEDVEFDHFDPGFASHRYWERAPEAAPLLAGQKGLNEVVNQIKAPQAWARSRGADVTIAIVDTGICPTLAEIPKSKRSPIDINGYYQGKHWQDPKGHGSMCATIAGGTKTGGGKFDGVAPDATILSARSTLTSTDLYRIYEDLILRKQSGEIPGPLVVSNSYGLYTCSAPGTLPQNHPYISMILDAIAEDIVVVFAAGNNHYDVLCNHDPTQCSPTTIWGANSHDDVICVGTVNEQETNQSPTTPHANSSRGPGEWAQEHPKPDCVAPTYGEVVWGCGYQVMNWWGTSGACPQVAGLAALMLSADPTMAPAQVADSIRASCKQLQGSWNCVGAGLIDCDAAVP